MTKKELDNLNIDNLTPLELIVLTKEVKRIYEKSVENGTDISLAFSEEFIDRMALKSLEIFKELLEIKEVRSIH